jgi:hypothetical protein
LITKKREIINKIIEFFDENFRIKINNTNIRLENILKTTSFHYMKKMESKNSFDEAMPWSNFFRKGEKQQWEKVLNKKQQSKINNRFKEYMNMFDYF